MAKQYTEFVTRKAQGPIMKSKHVHYLFSVSSGRGTEEYTVRKFPRGTPKEELRDALETWVDINNRPSESLYTVSFRPIKIPTRAVLLKKHSAVCNRRRKANTAMLILNAQLLALNRE